jgi:hypothetical protein
MNLQLCWYLSNKWRRCSHKWKLKWGERGHVSLKACHGTWCVMFLRHALSLPILHVHHTRHEIVGTWKCETEAVCFNALTLFFVPFCGYHAIIQWGKLGFTYWSHAQLFFFFIYNIYIINNKNDDSTLLSLIKLSQIFKITS